MVTVEDLRTHIVEGEWCQRHPRTHSSWRVSLNAKFLPAWNPQLRTQRPQPRQRHQHHQRPHLRPPHMPPCQPPSHKHTAYCIWSLWTSRRTLLVSLSSNFLFGDIKRGRGNSSLNNWLRVRLGRTNLLKQDGGFFRHTPKFNPKNVAIRLLHGEFIISFKKFNTTLIFYMTNLSAGIDVILIFCGLHWEWNSKFLNFIFHSLFCLHFINFSYAANYSSSANTMPPREFQSNSRLATHAD